MEGFLAVIFIYVLFPALCLFVLWLIGHHMEQRHLASIAQRRATYADMIVSTCKMPIGIDPSLTPQLVTGEMVVASDRYKTWLSGFRHLFGGEMKSLVSLYTRARDEATLRMMEAAHAQGFDSICGVRYDASDIGGNVENRKAKKSPMAICLASGTAYKRQRSH